MTNVLVTGGCGFIGSSLIALLQRLGGWRVTVLDNESSGRRTSLDGLRVERFIAADVRNEAAVADAVAGQDIIIHLAAQTDIMQSVADPSTDFEINVGGGLNLLKAAKAQGIRRFLFASSAAPVGMQPPPIHEDLAPKPAAPYGASKLAMEGYCSAFHHSYGLETLSLRFSNVYGPGSVNKSSVIALFIRNILEDKPLAVYGDGEQTRDFIYIEDLCRMIVAAAGHQGGGRSEFGQVYQVGTGTETSINQLIRMLKELAAAHHRRPLLVQSKPFRRGEILRNYCDPSRFQTTFGSFVTCDLRTGLEQTWSYFAKALSSPTVP